MKSQAYLHRPVTPSIGRQRKVNLRDLLASECCWNSKQAPRRGWPHCVSWVFYQRCYWLISSEEESRRRTWGNGQSQSAFRGEWKKPFKTEGDREQRACSAPVGELRPQWQYCMYQGIWMSVGGIKRTINAPNFSSYLTNFWDFTYERTVFFPWWESSHCVLQVGHCAL